MRIYLKMGLLVLTIICVLLIAYCSRIETKSYNRSETCNLDTTGKGYIEGTKLVVITENANTDGCVVALGIIAGASLIGISILTKNENI